MHRRKKVDEKSCVTPAGTSNELDVQNEWEENTHKHCIAERKGKERKEVPVRNYSINTSINIIINKLQCSTNLMSRMNGKKTHTHLGRINASGIE